MEKNNENAMEMESKEINQKVQEETNTGIDAEVEAKLRRTKRLELRHENIKAWNFGPDTSQFKNLDSNIKKNTAFIKKCRSNLNAETKQQLINDVKKLRLEKYIPEVVTSIVEGVHKCKTGADAWAAVEVISALHRRFPDTFTPLLTYQLAKAIAPANRQQLAALSSEQREREEASRVSRQRIVGRVICELWLVGALRDIEDGVAQLNATSAHGVDNVGKDNIAGLLSTTLKRKKGT
ncbi:uncharacterized protein VTP21DRAFT_6671 [Calcarisporiella thermophila]|uniref:uncharacterized protein n=1 Tax=Calcarisporiella thermophila TaxID=911321 RepID=UPI0037443DBE